MPSPRRPFTQIDNEILERMHEIGAGPFSVLAQLLRYRNRHSGQCNPSYAVLSRDTGLDRDTVMRHIKKLEKAGWLTKRASWAQEGDRSSNWYEFPDWILGDRTGRPGSRVIRLPTSQNAVSYDQGGRTIRPEPEENNQRERTTAQDVSIIKEGKPNKAGFALANVAMATASQQTCAHHGGKLVFDDVIVCQLCCGQLILTTPACQNGWDAEVAVPLSGEMH